MDDLQRLLIENECRKLTVLYCQHLDHLDPEAFANLYAEDAVYKPAVEPVPMQGRDRILQWARNYPKTRMARHVATNQLVDVVDDNHAKGSSYAVVFREPNPQADILSSRVTPRSVVTYSDTYRRTSEGWKFATRFYTMQFLEAEDTRRPIGSKGVAR